MKKKLFIGSSTHGLEVVQRVQKKIEEQCSEWLDCLPWNKGDIFEVNKSTLESLIYTTYKCDFAVLVATQDDILVKKDEIGKTMRDNVLYEAGLFTGSFGLNKTFIYFEEGVMTPTDLNGFTRIEFNSENETQKIQDLIKSITESASFQNCRLLPSTALAVGYFKNFIQPVYKKYHNKDLFLDILIPQGINNIKEIEEEYMQKRGKKSLRFFKERPILNKYRDKSLHQNHFWDIPSTLSTLDSIISNILPTDCIGESKDKTIIIQHEINNFVEALLLLIKKNRYENSINIIYLD